MSIEPTTYSGYRFPAEVIHHAIWLYCESIQAARRV
jgi:putative transposase